MKFSSLIWMKYLRKIWHPVFLIKAINKNYNPLPNNPVNKQKLKLQINNNLSSQNLFNLHRLLNHPSLMPQIHNKLNLKGWYI